MAQTDHEVGRVLSRLEDLGQLDNTLVLLIIGDNGASGEGGSFRLCVDEGPGSHAMCGEEGRHACVAWFCISSAKSGRSLSSHERALVERDGRYGAGPGERADAL
jgi:arylsulfatase A-like enzyme